MFDTERKYPRLQIENVEHEENRDLELHFRSHVGQRLVADGNHAGRRFRVYRNAQKDKL